MWFHTANVRGRSAAPGLRNSAIALAMCLTGLVGCQTSEHKSEGLRIEPRVKAPAGVEARLTATFIADSATPATVQLTGEDLERAVAAVSVLRSTGRTAEGIDLSQLAAQWSKQVTSPSKDEPGLRLQQLRIGLLAFPELEPSGVQPALSSVTAGLLEGTPTLPDVAALGALGKQLNQLSTSPDQWRKSADQVREAVAEYLAAHPQTCRTEGTGEVLPTFVAIRTLATLGYRCTMTPQLERGAHEEIGRLADSSDAWSAPEAILLAQVAIAGSGDSRQDAEDLKALKQKAHGALRDLLASNGSYFRSLPASLTELAVATATLTNWSARPAGADVSDAAAQALGDIALLRGRIPDQPEENSAIDGYLAAIAKSQLTGDQVSLPTVPRPTDTAPARDHVRFYLNASLRAGDPLNPEDVRQDASAYLKSVKNPLDRLTVTASATFALLRTDQPCVVVDQGTSELKAALTQAVQQFSQGSDAVRAWLALLWSVTDECRSFQQETASISTDFAKLLSVSAPPSANPTALAVAAWAGAEISCARGGSGRIPRPVDPVAFTESEDPGEGLGLGVYASLRAQEMAASPCAGNLADKLRQAA
ncbi:hypothetical protein OG883_31885 [Streptomyces sp. NBC_01142]|uniref:hypothetical protein n=1 Tax=Streptomyces sp. NBC_01142 TaxID=2975865 RepID=UPI002255B102|nr:hypothetical protein [Streptomyces sp. NBC_01142]MCX4824377.1 hypothetical protein [Streptomyces sp. NBC_01142]